MKLSGRDGNKYPCFNPFSLKTGGFARGAGHGSIKMYSIEPEELVGKRNAPVIFNTHGGGFFFPLGADEIKNMRMQHGPKMRTNAHGDFICRQKIQNYGIFKIKNNLQEIRK